MGETGALVSVLECIGQSYSFLTRSVDDPEVKNLYTCVIIEKKSIMMLQKAQNWPICILKIYKDLMSKKINILNLKSMDC